MQPLIDDQAQSTDTAQPYAHHLASQYDRKPIDIPQISARIGSVVSAPTSTRYENSTTSKTKPPTSAHLHLHPQALRRGQILGRHADFEYIARTQIPPPQCPSLQSCSPRSSPSRQAQAYSALPIYQIQPSCACRPWILAR